jgi:hypothetical protein
VSLFVWVITFDLSGVGGCTSSMRYRQQSSRDCMTTQAPPQRQSRDTFGRGLRMDTLSESTFHPLVNERERQSSQTLSTQREYVKLLINLRPNKLARAATLLPVLCMLFFSYFFPIRVLWNMLLREKGCCLRALLYLTCSEERGASIMFIDT